MFNMLYEIFKYLSSGVGDLIDIITSLPSYVLILFNYMDLLPVTIRSLAYVVVISAIIIGIKRLVL